MMRESSNNDDSIHLSKTNFTFETSFHARYDDFFLVTRTFGIHAELEASNCRMLHFMIPRHFTTLLGRILYCIDIIISRCKIEEDICTINDWGDILVIVIVVSVMIPKQTAMHC